MLDRFNTLVHRIYDGCTNPSDWPHIVSAIAEDLGADKAVLLTPFDAPERGGFIFPHNISQQNLSLWASRYLPEDIWARRVNERNLGQEGNVVLGQELVTDRELLDSTWYREFLSRMDIFHIIAGMVFWMNHGEYPVTNIAFFRGIDAPSFGEEQRRLLRLLVPHISRSLGVMMKLRDAEFRVAASLQALNEIRHGILLLDQQGRVCFANSAAENILRREDGLKMSPATGSLSTDDPDARAALEHALHANVPTLDIETSHFSRVIPVRRTSGAASYAVQVSYLPENNPWRAGGSLPRAIVFIKDGSVTTRPDPAFLQQVYGLTQAEARAALALCDGDSLEAVAAQLNVKLNTLKTHLKSIYAKTSVDNRAALTKLMLSLAAA